MTNPVQSPSQTLTWSKEPGSGHRAYLLGRNGSVVGSLRWQKMWGSLAVGKTPAGSWTFKRVGFFDVKVSVRLLDTETEIASFHPSMFGGGRIVMRDGRSWRLQARGFFHKAYELYDSTGTLSLTLEESDQGAEITLRQLGLDGRTTYLLSLIVWHAALLAKDDASAAAVIAVCS